jgi:uncharacterized coiled-coil protein SlyX
MEYSQRIKEYVAKYQLNNQKVQDTTGRSPQDVELLKEQQNTIKDLIEVNKCQTNIMAGQMQEIKNFHDMVSVQAKTIEGQISVMNKQEVTLKDQADILEELNRIIDDQTTVINQQKQFIYDMGSHMLNYNANTQNNIQKN